MSHDLANAADVPADALARLGVHHVRRGAEDALGLPARVLGRVGTQRVRLYVDRVAAPKGAEVRGRLAEMLVRETAETESAVAIAVVRCPTFGARLWHDVIAFVDRFAPGAGVVLVGEHGRVALHVPVLHLHQAPGRQHAPEGSRSATPLFTDLNRWLLKILLLRVAPDRYRPRTFGPVLSQVDLARESGVSPATVHRLWRRLVPDGHLVLTPEPRLARVPQLLASWIAVDVQARPQTLAARPIVAHGWTVDTLLGATVGPRRAITGTVAADRLGVRHQMVQGNVPQVVVDGDLGAAAAAWRLAVCDPRDASVLLTSADHPESVFRGVALVDGVPCVDLLQAGLDAASQPMLGLAQAEHISAIIAGWHSR